MYPKVALVTMLHCSKVSKGMQKNSTYHNNNSENLQNEASIYEWNTEQEILIYIRHRFLFDYDVWELH